MEAEERQLLVTVVHSELQWETSLTKGNQYKLEKIGHILKDNFHVHDGFLVHLNTCK